MRNFRACVHLEYLAVGRSIVDRPADFREILRENAPVRALMYAPRVMFDTTRVKTRLQCAE